MIADRFVTQLPKGALSYEDAKGIAKTRHSVISLDSPIEFVYEVLTKQAKQILVQNGKKVRTVKDFLALSSFDVCLWRNSGRKTVAEYHNIQRVFQDIIEHEKKTKIAKGVGVIVNLHASARYHFFSPEKAEEFISRKKNELGVDEEGNFTMHGTVYHLEIFKTPVAH